MKKAFTLVELLVVIGIMGLLGTVSVGGYRAMQRGMADRGAMESVNSFVRAAYQRAQIDRQPTAVFFWNETLREADDHNTEIVVGKAVAVRRAGRISKVEGSKYLFDEFDLDNNYEEDEDGNYSEQDVKYLYCLDNPGDIESSSTLKRTLVYQKVYGDDDELPTYLSGSDNNGSIDLSVPSGNNGGRRNLTVPSGETVGKILKYAFVIKNQGSISWKSGMAYGFEFATLQLPHGYIFGSDYSKEASSPIREAGTLVFNVGQNSGSGTTGGTSGRKSVTISSLLPNTSGELAAKSIGSSQDPTEDM